jgi:hypothetical protein
LLDFPIGEIGDRTDDIADDVASLPHAHFATRPFGGRRRNDFGYWLSEARYADRLIGPTNTLEDRQAGSLKLGDGNLFHKCNSHKNISLAEIKTMVNDHGLIEFRDRIWFRLNIVPL